MDEILNNFVAAGIPGAAGGIVSFLHAMNNDHYKNNKYLLKFSIETGGGCITATFIAPLLAALLQFQFAAFATGLAWSMLVQTVRNSITKIVENTLDGVKQPNGDRRT